MILYSKFAYRSQFFGEKNDLKILYLIAEILTLSLATFQNNYSWEGGGAKTPSPLIPTFLGVSSYHPFKI